MTCSVTQNQLPSSLASSFTCPVTGTSSIDCCKVDWAVFAINSATGQLTVAENSSLDYETMTHHTNMDVYEAVPEQDLQQAAIIVAAFVYLL